MTKRDQKKIVIASVFFLVFILTPGVLLYLHFLQNGTGNIETTPDELLIKGVKAIKISQNRADLVATVENPNSTFGAQRVSYEFLVETGGEKMEVIKTGETFLLPSQTKHIIEPEITSDKLNFSRPISLRLKVKNWTSLSRYQEPSLWVATPSYEILEEGRHFLRVTGTLVNDSFFRFKRGYIRILVWDDGDKLVGVSKTTAGDLRPNEQRDFTTFIDYPLPSVGRLEFEADTNVFSNSSFLDQYE